MGHYISENGGFCYKRDTQDGHGGHAYEHHQEMRKIAHEEIKNTLPQVYKEAYSQAMHDLLNALRADISTIVDISLSTGEQIFHSEQLKHALLENLYREIVSKLDSEYRL